MEKNIRAETAKEAHAIAQLHLILCKTILCTFERNALPLCCSGPIEFQVALTFNLPFNSIKHCDIQSRFELLILPESDQLQDYLTNNQSIDGCLLNNIGAWCSLVTNSVYWMLQQIWWSPNLVSTPFLSDPGVPGVRSMGPDVRHTWFADLTDVTLADEDINSIPADDVNRAILGNVAMQVVPPGGQNWN